MFDLSAKNPLINIKPNKLWLIDVDLNNAQNIYKKQQFYLKEYALQTSLLASHFIKWKHPQKNIFYTSPLYISEVKIVKNQKIELNYKYEVLTKKPTINPLIKHVFKTLFGIDIIDNLNIDENIHQLKQLLESNGSNIVFKNQFTNSEQWEIIKINAIGTFNYKKAVLAQDYNKIQLNPNHAILNLLGETTDLIKESKTIEVVNLDNSQTEAVKSSLIQNTVVQGPPGTGKSNTIVELIKQCLIENKKILFVSEKKSALDVVYQKLNKEGLSNLIAYFDGTKQQKKQFYRVLKQSINLTQNNIINDNELKTTDLKIKELKTSLNAYLSISKINPQHGVSIKTLFDEIIIENYKTHNTNTTIPPYKLWAKYQVFFEELEELVTSNFTNNTTKANINTLSQTGFIHLNKAIFLQNQPIDLLHKRLNELKDILNTFSQIEAIYHLNWTWKDWYMHSIAASILQMANRTQLEILDPKSKKYKSFNTWSKKYDLLKHKLKIADNQAKNWKIKPKLNQIDYLIDELKHNKLNLFSIFKNSKTKQVFKHYNQNLSKTQQIEVLNQLKSYYKLKFDLEEVTIKLKHNLGILNPDVEINQLMAMRQKLESNSHQQYVFLLEHPLSLQLIEDLHQLQPKIQQANQIKQFLFNQPSNLSILNLQQLIKQIEINLPQYNYYLPEIKKCLGLPQEIINFIKQNPLTIHKLSSIVVHHTLNSLLRFEPDLKQLSGQKLWNNFIALKTLNLKKNKQITQQIIANKQIYWQKINTLINTPTSKLKTQQKKQKKELKNSKKLIFHESAKQQQHLPVKQLLKQSEKLLFNSLPLWIMNPLTIAESLPCKADIFDIIIFDEASQIPLEDSLPAVYRAKQLVIVGDNKQMPPSQFFSNQTQTQSLLTEAETNLVSKMLTTHYRSHHPKLMQFSNQYFYDNELNYFPPATNEPPFILNYVTNGLFQNNKNTIEAKAVAQTYYQYLKNGKTNVGIIAFSAEQEQEIIKQIKTLQVPNNPQLLIRNLENAQGIEKEYIIISVGYGFNEKGQFRQHFGPINQAYGANRLNVLLTRAQKQITLCTSITSSHFKPSLNTGVQLLKNYLAFIEQEHYSVQQYPNLQLHQIVHNYLKSHQNIQYIKAVNGQTINAFINKQNLKILLIDPCLNSNETQDIYTLFDVLSQRYSKIKILLSIDYILNKDRFKNEILTFLSNQK